MKPKYPPPPPPETLDDAPDMPDMTASWWSHLFFLWVQPIMALGAARELTAEDMYKLGHERDSGVLSKKLLASFQRRWDEADAYNAKLEAGEIPVPRKLKIKWALGAGEGKTRQEKEKEWRTNSGKRQPSLTWALSDVFGMYFWMSGLIKVSFAEIRVCQEAHVDWYHFRSSVTRPLSAPPSSSSNSFDSLPNTTLLDGTEPPGPMLAAVSEWLLGCSVSWSSRLCQSTTTSSVRLERVF
jgi:hypothetical protein